MTAIVFDLDRTVLHFDRPYRDILADAIADVRGDATDTWIETYDEAFSRPSSRAIPIPSGRPSIGSTTVRTPSPTGDAARDRNRRHVAARERPHRPRAIGRCVRPGSPHERRARMATGETPCVRPRAVLRRDRRLVRGRRPQAGDGAVPRAREPASSRGVRDGRRQRRRRRRSDPGRLGRIPVRGDGFGDLPRPSTASTATVSRSGTSSSQPRSGRACSPRRRPAPRRTSR